MVEKAKSTELSGFRRGADITFGYLAQIFALFAVIQIALAGVGTFAGHEDNRFMPHIILGSILGLASVVLLILALIARRSRAIVIGSIVLVLLAEGAQHVLANLGWDNKWLGGLHALSGVIVMMIAGWMGSSTIRLYRRKP